MATMDHGTEPSPYTLTGEAFRTATIDLGDSLARLPPDHLDTILGGGTEDQIRAAARDVYATVKQAGGRDQAISSRAMGFMAAVLTRCQARCPHLAKPRPVVAVLAIEGLVCYDCIHTPLMERLTPPLMYCDRCDFCREHGHEIFWQTTIGYGAAMVIGDACRGCHDLMAEMGLD